MDFSSKQLLNSNVLLRLTHNEKSAFQEQLDCRVIRSNIII